VINPADETPFAVISLGSAADVDKAVAAARRAFPAWSRTSKDERLACLRKLRDVYERRGDEMAKTMSQEMGAPIRMSKLAQVGSGLGHIEAFIKVLEDFEFEHPLSPDKPGERILHEPIGVCGLITPWNWPMNQVTLKVVPAVAAGCTVILKPSEVAPLSAMLFAEMMDEAGFPAGVFNLVNGDGPTVGEAMSRHPGHRHDVVHRLHARRHRGHQGGRRHGQARDAGTRRQVAQHRLRRRRPGQDRQARHHELLPQHRPVLRCADPHAGRALGL
jgi:aldehyde dehydrogenase (NAD+)